MQTENKEIIKCWICNAIADSKEHRIKRSDIVSKHGKESYKNENELCIVNLEKDTTRKIQGANSDLLKYEKSLCAYCNNTRTQPFDKAYEKFIDYIDKNKTEILYKRFIDFYKVYGDNFEEKQRNLYKYFIKSFGCRLAYFKHYISSK